MSYYIGPRFNGTWLYLEIALIKNTWLVLNRAEVYKFFCQSSLILSV